LKKALIIGGGFAGCATAHQLELLGNWDVTLIEKSHILGAGVRTHWYGGHPHTYGPRHFLTDNENVYEYLNKYCPLRLLHHQMITYIESDGAFYNFPIHKDDIEKMPDADQIKYELNMTSNFLDAKNLEEYWIRSVGETLYNKFIKYYNHKMWLIDDNKRLDTFEWSQKIKVTKVREEGEKTEQLPNKSPIKEGPREAYDDVISAYPLAPNGYNDYFDISTNNTKVMLSTTIEKFDIPQKSVFIDGNKYEFDIIINTISPDILFDFSYGELPFIGRDIHKIVLPQEECFPDNVFFLYYANQEEFTRIVEYKKFTQHKAPTTLLGLEIPSLNGKYYPLPFKKELIRAKRYFNEMPENVFSIGRAGTYDYNIDIDDCIAQSMDVIERIR